MRSRYPLRFLLALLFWCGGAFFTLSAQGPRDSPVSQNPGPQQLFEQGETALRAGNLEQAERSFRAVLAIDPQVAGAYANLGVIEMRRKHWQRALENLNQAARLAPQVSGIRLNIGLAYYRQGNYQAAILPSNRRCAMRRTRLQARYLLGLCYFFNERYADAANTLEPLWPQESNEMNYLYVLGIAANKAQRPELEQRALGRLVRPARIRPNIICSWEKPT